MRVLPILQKLPRSYLHGIGAVCFQWALQERALQVIAFYLLNIGPKHGRVAVRSPRADEQLAMIRQLMTIEKVTVESVDLDKHAEALRAFQKIRDLLAHGIWIRHPDGYPLLQDLSGNWKPDPKGPKVARRIMPGALLVREEDFRTSARGISECTKVTHQLGFELRAKIEPLRNKSPQQSPSASRPDDLTQDKPEPPRPA